MCVDTHALGLLPEGDAIVIGDLFYGVGLSGCARLVAFDVVTGDEDTVAGEDLTGLEEGDIADEQFLDVDNAFNAVTDDLDTSFFLLVVEDAELSLLLPIIE